MTKVAATRTAERADSLETTYESVRKVLLRHVPPFVPTGADKTKPQLHLTVPNPVVVPGACSKRAQHVGLACVMLQKGYVGFYYLPLYLDPKIGRKLSPRLMKLLKGKTCFHIKLSDAELERDIDTALKIGTDYFRGRGWI